MNHSNHGRRLLSAAAVVLGNAGYSLTVALFLEPAGLVAGGATGVALAFGRLTGLSVSGFLLAFNLVMLVWGWVVLGRAFALNTLASSILSPIFLGLAETMLHGRVLTDDLFLNTVFAAIGVGAFMGIVIRAGASTGGMDIPPLVLQKWFRWPVSATMLIFDIAVILIQIPFSPVPQLTKKLARLYGADLTVDARPMGANHNLCVSVTGIKDQFALEGEPLTQEYAELALGTAFHPYFVGETFDPEAVKIEKQMLKKALEDEVNEKRLYCQRQANREFFGDSPAGVRQEGYLEEVEGLTARQLTDAYYEMLRAASIELIVLGCGEAQTEAVKNALLEELSQVERAPAALAENMAMPRREPMQPRQLAAVPLAMALYGGSVTSRLFLNVRERDHLCYYCSSSFQSFTGSMAVNSGVEHADAARAEKAVLKELADLCDGPITDEELEDCRRSLLSGMTGLEDTLGGIETWYYMEVLRGGPIQSPDEARAALCAVTKEDVRAILRALTLSVSYCLTREEGSTHA